jgi:hypothetical protein
MPEGEYKEFIVGGVNLNTVRNDDEERPYKEDDPYFEPNNAGYYGIVWMNYIYNYCAIYLGPKATNNFFPRPTSRSLQKAYKEDEIKHWILASRIATYTIFILSLEYLSICLKKGATLEECQEPMYLEHYIAKA